jgi:DNA polymerase-3 subunit epsilon
MVTDREKATFWARSLLESRDWVLLDTETTGISSQDEIVQIAVMAPDGAALLNTLICPTRPIPLESTQIHGITDADVQDAPLFPEIFDRLKEITAGKRIIVYNASFDVRLIRQTLAKYDKSFSGIEDEQVECAMLQYSAWFGELWPNGGYKWQRLRGGDHTALGDCRATLAVIRKMAGEDPEETSHE